ncbi:MAG: Hsp20/alpha crystallin family protein [Candidatus Nitrosocosmicus sp.]
MSSSSDAANTNATNKTKSNKIEIETEKNDIPVEKDNSSRGIIAPVSSYYEDFFENFKQNMQHMTNIVEQSWPSSSIFPNLRSVSPFEWFDKWIDTRLPLCDVIDRGDKYELKLEIPGIDKDKVDIKATKNSIRISGIQSGKTKEKGKNYIYSERSYKSFHRQIPFIDEILPSKITASIDNGILDIELPKKVPTKGDSEEYKVNIT